MKVLPGTGVNVKPPGRTAPIPSAVTFTVARNAAPGSPNSGVTSWHVVVLEQFAVTCAPTPASVNRTVVPPGLTLKLLPVSVTAVPPVIGPVFGDNVPVGGAT